MIKLTQIVLLSEVFLSKDMLESALSKSNISYQVMVTGSMNDALEKINVNKFQIFITDTYMTATIPESRVLEMIQFNNNVSFLLINYSHDDKSTLYWFDFGFGDVVTSNNPLGLTLSIKREIRNARIRLHNAFKSREIFIF